MAELVGLISINQFQLNNQLYQRVISTPDWMNVRVRKRRPSGGRGCWKIKSTLRLINAFHVCPFRFFMPSVSWVAEHNFFEYKETENTVTTIFCRIRDFRVWVVSQIHRRLFAQLLGNGQFLDPVAGRVLQHCVFDLKTVRRPKIKRNGIGTRRATLF